MDGIESAQPELYQRISSLCDLEYQNLTIYDNGPEYIYTKNSSNPDFKIHENFRLFITYNPKNVDPQKKLTSGFLNKCSIYSLSELDESLENTSLILSGMFIGEKKYMKTQEI